MSRAHRLLATIAAILGASALVGNFSGAVDPKTLAAEIEMERDHISALDLAKRIVRGDANLRIFDLRSRPEFEEFHIPGAQQIGIEQLMKDPLPRDADIVLYSEGGAHAAQAWVLVRMRGYRRVHLLREGIYEWHSRVYDPRLAVDAIASERAEFERAAALSRFFGGNPVSGVPRAEVPTGYWTHGSAGGHTPVQSGSIRRRGC